MKTSKNKRTETAPEDNKIVDNINNRVDAKNDLQTTLDAILTTLRDIKDIVEKRKPISSEDLFHQVECHCSFRYYAKPNFTRVERASFRYCEKTDLQQLG